ncbi:class I SAM-dependent RNA methyltransferase [Comamonadaceae bacterium OH2545_COT-014]|nr:class I SAM-dependent RNA methyltransferase [Comamonadaceae bacterium OH2545_COT-014]
MTAPLTLFLPCAAGVEDFLADEVHGLTGLAGHDLLSQRGGVRVRGGWAEVMRLNLWSRLAQRVLIELAHAPCPDEQALYALAFAVPWEQWFTPRHTFRVDITAQGSPLRSLNFAALRVKDAVADRFRQRAGGVRPSVDTACPQVRVHAHLTAQHATLYIDTSGEPLFKRGWRQDKGDAPLKETLAAAMLAACGWWLPAERRTRALPLYDPCCGSGTIVIEAAQLACGLPPGGQRRFAFEHLAPFDPAAWNALKKEANSLTTTSPNTEKSHEPLAPPVRVFGSDVAHRMVDFAQRNAERAGVAHALQLRGGDALQRQPPTATPGIILMNPPYGERIAVAGTAAARGKGPGGGRERFHASATLHAPAHARAPGADCMHGDAQGDDFFRQLSQHWKSHYAGWQAWLLTPDRALPGRLRLKESRRVPLWNGPIECRLLRFDLRTDSSSAA